MKRTQKYFGISIAVLVLSGTWFLYGPRKHHGCRLTEQGITVSTVKNGVFQESIPQSGHLMVDSIDQTIRMHVEIDVMYLERIRPGMKCISLFKDRMYRHQEYHMEITEVDTVASNGRFAVKMNFIGDKLPEIFDNRREVHPVRIFPSEATYASLLNVGGFFKDSGGKYVFVLRDSLHAVKRPIKLGRKSPDYFEVLEGLQPGDRVITSSYENFNHLDSLGPLEMAVLQKMYWR